jgi:Domain of unknown function (DUF4382)/Carboxypeptidase regulatory-like domain
MKKLIFPLFAAALVLLFSGCTKSNDGLGQLVVKITDGPFPIDYVGSATVTITKVELRKEGDCECDGSPFIVVWEGSETFDLIKLRNGQVEELPQIEIPQGKYDLVRIYVDEAKLVINNGGEFDLKVPGGKQTGIKVFINPGLVVEGGLTAELVLDFDLSGSFVMRGNMDSPAGINGFIFKPVIKAANNSTAGRIEGLVTEKDNAGVVIEAATIEIFKQGETEVFKTGSTDASGKYVIIGLPEGTYTVSASKANYETVTVNEVKIIAGNKTEQDFVLPKI